MSQILKVGQKVQTESSGMTCEVKQFLGGGGQGEVYRAILGEKPVALKWYFPSYLQYDNRLRERLEKAIELGQPSDRFLWPIELSSAQGVPAFGYIMLLREPHYKSITDLMLRRVEPTFRVLAMRDSSCRTASCKFTPRAFVTGTSPSATSSLILKLGKSGSATTTMWM